MQTEQCSFQLVDSSLVCSFMHSLWQFTVFLCAQVRYADSDDDDDDENGIDDEVFAQKMHQQLNSSRPRRAAAMQATAQMMVSMLHLLSLLLCLYQLHHLRFCLLSFTSARVCA